MRGGDFAGRLGFLKEGKMKKVKYDRLTKKDLIAEIYASQRQLADAEYTVSKKNKDIKHLKEQSARYEKEAADCYQQAIDNALSVKNIREVSSSKIQCVYSALELVFHTVSVDKPLNLRDKAAAKICNETLILINDFSKNRKEKWDVLYSALKDIFLEDVY
ncbi:MAG: hypothetical protein GY841_00965 [FCB group bacterium]|nr:hypothetical protein [FCB group bacterium]